MGDALDTIRTSLLVGAKRNPIPVQCLLVQLWDVNGAAVAGFDSGTTGGPETLIYRGDSNVLFYWAVGGAYTVTYAVSGISGTAYFQAAAPSVTVTPANGTDIFLVNNGSAVGAGCGHGVAPDVCVTLGPTVTAPAGYSGNYQWVQVVNSFTLSYTASDGSQHSCSPSQSTPALDNTNPYPNSANVAFMDSPLIAVTNDGSLQSVSVGNSFLTFLMW